MSISHRPKPLAAALWCAAAWLARSEHAHAQPVSPERERAAPAPHAAHGVERGREQRRERRERRCDQDPRVQLGLVSLETCIGADLFFRETFGGNGRTCGSCHPASNNYTIDADYIADLPDSDPLFVAEQRPALAQLEHSDILRDSAMILVNADGLQDPTNKFVMRSVPHILGLAVSTVVPIPDPESAQHALDGTLLPFPAERLGWTGDGAPGEGRLRDFADGAIVQHAPRTLERRQGSDFFLPDDAERDALASFMRSVGRMNDLDLEEVALFDATAARGQASFTGGQAMECAFRCHTNAGATADIFDSIFEDKQFMGVGNLTLDIGTPLVRLPAVEAVQTLFDGGFGTDPLDSNGDGAIDSFGNGGFNVPPLIEAADTGPMFHSNAFETLEDAIRFYATPDFAVSLVGANGFLNRMRGAPMPLTETDISEVGRFLRVLNTSLNLQMALHRIDAAAEIASYYGTRQVEVENGLLRLAAAELVDAIEVLSAVAGLHEEEQCLLGEAEARIATLTRRSWSASKRRSHLRITRELVADANEALGVGLEMEMGEGTLMY